MPRLKKLDPKRCEVGIHQNRHQVRRLCTQFHFFFLCAPRRILQSRQHILTLYVWNPENFLDGVAHGKLAKDRADSQTRTLDARFPLTTPRTTMRSSVT